jgi:sphingomyelin phosphodiesterase
MMPWWTFQSPRNEARAEAIAAELLKLDFDILCLQKVFDRAAQNVLASALGSRYPHRYGPANSSFSLKLSSGVWMLSRFPLWNYREIEFNKLGGIEVFSRKGAMLMTGTVEGHRFHIVGTHLQGDDSAGYNPEHQAIRKEEVIQIEGELVKPNAEPGMPVFFCGDFCTPRRDGDDRTNDSKGYRHMIETFGVENGPEDRITLDDNLCRNDLAADNIGRTAELDYILVRANGTNLRTEWSRLILRHCGWDGSKDRLDLSYRYAVGASVWFPRL